MRERVQHRRGPAMRRGQVPHRRVRSGDDPMKRILPFAIVAILAACAVTTAESEPNGPPATIDVPEASTPDAVVTDAGNGLDAACDPADPNCVTKPISCAEAAWCPVATGVSSLFVLTNVWGKGA